MKNLFSKKSSTASKKVKTPDLTSGPSLEPMTNQRLDELIKDNAQNVQGQLGYWQLNISGRDLLVITDCLLYTSPSPRDQRGSRMPSSA